MKKIFTLLLTLALVLSLPACGNGGDNSGGAPGQSQQQEQQEAPDLSKFYDDFMASLGDDTPMMMDLTEDDGALLDQFYPGLSDCGNKQIVVQGAAISAVAFEMALIEVENIDDVQAVSDIFQARIDTQIKNGAYYPATVESWEKAAVITRGSVVALICAGDQQAKAEEAFNALFE